MISEVNGFTLTVRNRRSTCGVHVMSRPICPVLPVVMLKWLVYSTSDVTFRRSSSIPVYFHPLMSSVAMVFFTLLLVTIIQRRSQDLGGGSPGTFSVISPRADRIQWGGG